MSSEVIRVVVPLTGAESLLETVQLLGPAHGPQGYSRYARIHENAQMIQLRALG